MALFSRKKEEKKETPVKEGEKTVQPAASGNISGSAHVLRNPRITEKGTMHAGESAYLFDVTPRATKQEIAQAVTAIYNVKPRMVRVVTIALKRKRNPRTGREGVKKGGKKAYVYLKKGETITIT